MLCRLLRFYVMIEIVEIGKDRKRYLGLLLMADEQESMIDRYIARGDMFAAVADGKVCGVCVVTDEGGGTAEIKNLAVEPAWRGKGVGRMMVDFVRRRCRGRFFAPYGRHGRFPLHGALLRAVRFPPFARGEGFFRRQL